MSLKKANEALVEFIKQMDVSIKKFPGGDERKKSPMYKDLSDMREDAVEMQNTLVDIIAEVDTATSLSDKEGGDEGKS